MLPEKVKKLIEEYCMGVEPEPEQYDEIFDAIAECEADNDEASAYMEELMSGPTKEERRQAELEAALQEQERRLKEMQEMYEQQMLMMQQEQALHMKMIQEEQLRRQQSYTLSITSCGNLLTAMMTTRTALGWSSADARAKLSSLPVEVKASTNRDEVQELADQLTKGGLQVSIECVNGMGEKVGEPSQIFARCEAKVAVGSRFGSECGSSPVITASDYMQPNYPDLDELCKKIEGKSYIDTLHLNRSWILPKFVDMGYKEGRLKKFSIDAYTDAVSNLDYGKCWATLLRNYKALSQMKDKNSASYKIRSGWWTKEVAVAMAEYDIKLFKKFVSKLTVKTNSRAGNYVIIPHMKDEDPYYKENYYYCEIPKKEPLHGWSLWNDEDRNLPNAYSVLDMLADEIRKVVDDKALFEAVANYDDARAMTEYHRYIVKMEYPKEFKSAFMGDGAYSSMMTMAKHLDLQFKDDSGNTMSRDNCVKAIAQKAMDSGFDGTKMLEFCVEKYFDSGVLDYKAYKR
jgi:hypothetical protein